MIDKTYSYATPEALNLLFQILSPTRCELSVVLRPNIPEFIDAVLKTKVPSLEEALACVPDLSETFLREADVMKKGKLGGVPEYQVYRLMLFALCEKHGILPFWSLYFNRHCTPEIDFTYHDSGGIVDCDFGRMMCRKINDPIIFTQARKWFGVKFTDVKEEKFVNSAKAAVNGFIDSGYIITSLSADLDPRIIRGDHYSDSYESKASLRAGRGKIHIQGDVDLDLSNLSIQEITQTKQLPMLE